MIRIHDMTYRVAGRILFEAASATVPKGHKVGLIGRNGCGKSTLLKLLIGDVQPDSGMITIDGVKDTLNGIGTVSQEAPSGEQTPLEFALSADKERTELIRRSKTETDPDTIAEIQTRLFDIGAHSAPAKAATILAGLGFNNDTQNQPLSSFSGGWRMRVAIAALLFAEPEILLLDEPTNHLDLEATIWLETHLKAYPKTLLIVSHDRGLLNRAVNGILHVEAHRITFYNGGYDRFEKLREEKLALQEAIARKQDAQRKHMEKFVERFRYTASKARQAQSRLKALEKMGSGTIKIAEANTVFLFPEPALLPPPLITLDQASVGYAVNEPVLTDISIRLDADDRIGFLGQNGNGKSTLAKLIANRLEKMSGDSHRAAKLKVGFFAQHQIEELTLDDNATEHMARLMPSAPLDRVRARLGGVGLIQDKQTTKVKFLSGGEKARLTIALITHDNPHVLILDEPTNHLDIDARDALVTALNNFKGAVILISHDRRLLELTVDRLWLIADGTVQPFNGDLDDYSSWLRERAKEPKDQHFKIDQKKQIQKKNKKEMRQNAANKRKANAELRKRVQQLERRLQQLTSKREQIISRLGDNDTYELSTSDLKQIIFEKEKVDIKITETEGDWLQASEMLELAK
ncbi:MAG: glycosyl transferase family 1 [Rhodospirillaceae bacterium]|nr:glycosyl transferase family 1 [Rhodospirillaceae bacterium]MDG1273373.1 ABC-F family ATP-binding cassette domain-containing protein [Alphaproteobacteria bacterium]